MADIDLELVDGTEFDDEDVANEVYKSLERFRAKSNQVAIYLGLPPDTVDAIRDNYPKDNAGALRAIIVSWVRQEHNVGKFGYPSWRKVVEAAIGAGNKLEARKIAKAHPATPGVPAVKTLKPSSPQQPLPADKIIAFNVLDRRTAEIDGGGSKKLQVEIFDPFNLDRRNLQPIRFTFGLVRPKGGSKASVVDEYNMATFPHGTALIINNEDFAKQSDREGTAIDERNLTHTFRFLGYRVEVHRNLNSKAMLAIMTEMGTRDHSQGDSFVCCILSHGKEGHVYGTDSIMVSLDDLSKRVDTNHCPSLAGKPKLFFLQACRGKMKEESVRVGTDAGDEPSIPSEPIRVATDTGTRVATDSDSQVPATADFFFGFATPLGYVAWRDLDHGSWYVAELCKALSELSTHASLSDIMTKVRHEVGHQYENIGYRMSPETTNRLQKNVFF